ncbi:ATP-dependent RNA helicase DBP5, putative [Plasmodium berghei]|uniref:RNA helicase n=2 Tax=Plasmodium berghei TaxID=5821 RepID=A0A509APW8_PLABA|nr:ATP-dependent RNA helicase DBP5, putative [Plasmodium berghei ANKA]CXI93587.1 ATP-dependent RNA helicase DBP5, putative [Plasmodium berghei]SCL96857.1 ATP-dependent RNA helicase DBP5, putative [Plasmodium berghei]SCM16502.1 ATP-dependent RNA helicase DBP5, putative [Plasmodium berghei]SCM18296.1 ATP-dependent RNA helicase DBP5, putative [Plasmodium berghei]SCN27725.1 ATP-dependent RNA helicase DBP5, putative [Plasmodium berghei]|eukprot:XP_034423379.1 ATP-dependent RNA helicase DBP5, putative [Plasmodium berghei ANKA]
MSLTEENPKEIVDEKVNEKIDEKVNEKIDEKVNEKNDEKINDENGKEDEDATEKKEDENVMGMFLSYLQKNKDDPKVLQTMLSMMGGKGVNMLPEDILKLTQGNKKKDENSEEKSTQSSSKVNQTNESENNGTGISADNKKDKEKENNDKKNGDLNGENKDVIKKKHSELVEDNDDYEIENCEQELPLEEEAISLIENINITNDGNNKSNNEESSKESIKKTNGVSISANMAKLADKYMSFGKNAETTGKEQSDFKLYHSKNTWEELKIDNELIQILTYLKFFGPSKIQAYALPIILDSNKNLIAQSQNGSGKTLTFVIAMLSKINRTLYSLQAVCICPTRELAQQNYDVVGKFTKYLNVNTFLAVPLCEKYNKSSGFQIYVGTPGKTLDFLKRKYIDTNNIKIFVLDEADDLIDIKNNMSSQVESIKRFLPKTCQILLFSATYNDNVRVFADKFAPRATKISVRQEDLTLKCVKQYYLITENDEQKYYYLSELYCSMTISQCVIFVNSKKSAYNLYQFMTDNNHNVTLICADSVISRFTKNKVEKTNVMGMDPKTRDSLMSDFKKGISKVLICTDLLSRGIDVPSISLVINFDLPYIYQGRITNASDAIANQNVNMETYIHRIGRTGRFGTKGMAINFISKIQIPHIHQIEKYYKCVISDLEYDSELMMTSITKLKN